MEDFFVKVASMNPEKDAILVYDRGYLDNMAYMTKEGKDLYVKITGVNLEEIRDSRYDMVIHMVTAANGAADAYTLSNNKARSEGIQQAIEIDNKIKDAWVGHQNHVYGYIT
jgi:AAA domain